MKALLDPAKVAGAPAFARWLEHAEAPRRLVAENYAGLSPDRLVDVLVEENVLAQLESLRTHPAVNARLARGDLTLHAWVYSIERGEVFQFDGERGQFERIERAARPASVAVRRLKAASGI
jgi:carbonic anhydrase